MQVNGDSGSGLQSEINITPLVDVVLVLLIIFMVVVPLLIQGYDVDIPQTSAETAPPQVDEAQVVLSVEPAACKVFFQPEGDGLPSDCRVSLGDREVAAADVPVRVAELLGGRPSEGRILFLNADDRLNYEGVLRIVDLAKSRVDDLKIEFITTD